MIALQSNELLAERVRGLRLQLGLSQADLAARLDVPQPNVCRIEAGETDVRLSTVFRLAAALETTAEKLIAD